MGFKHEDNMNS